MNEILLSPLGFAYLRLDIKPRHSSTMASISFKVDTGANCTTISSERLCELGFDFDWIKSGIPLEGFARPTVASGLPVNDCYQVVLPEIRIGNWVGYN